MESRVAASDWDEEAEGLTKRKNDLWTWTTVRWLLGERGCKRTNWWWAKYNKDLTIFLKKDTNIRLIDSAQDLDFDPYVGRQTLVEGTGRHWHRFLAFSLPLFPPGALPLPSPLLSCQGPAFASVTSGASTVQLAHFYYLCDFLNKLSLIIWSFFL